MHIQNCNYVMDKSHLSRYKYLKNNKAVKKTVINDQFNKENY